MRLPSSSSSSYSSTVVVVVRAHQMQRLGSASVPSCNVTAPPRRVSARYGRAAAANAVVGQRRFSSKKPTVEEDSTKEEISPSYVSCLMESPSHRNNSHHYVEYKEPISDPATVITNNRLENKPYLMILHRSASLVSDKVAYLLVKALRIPADLFFAKKCLLCALQCCISC